MSISNEIRQIDHLLTVEDLSARTQLAKKTIYAKVKAATIPVTRLGGSIRFDPKLIADWLERQTANAI